ARWRARILYRLASDDGDDGHRCRAFGDHGVPPGPRRPGVRGLWLAVSVHALGAARAPLRLFAVEARRVALVPEAEDHGQGVRQSDARLLRERAQLEADPACAVRLHRASERHLVHEPVLRARLYADGADGALRQAVSHHDRGALARGAILRLLRLALGQD